MNLNSEQLKTFQSMNPDFRESDLPVIAQICKSRELDPFAGHVHFGKRGGKIVTTLTVDGARARAARTGEYAGSDKPLHTDSGCEVTVYRMVQGHRCGFTSELLMKEFNSGMSNWKKMPNHMLAKCAEVSALRKGFPETCGGMYAEGEHIPEDTVEPTQIPERPTDAVRWSKVVAAFATFGIDEATILGDKRVKADKVEDLDEDDYKTITAWHGQCVASNA